jgi:cGMP-dependent protein kinase interacting domain
MDTLKSENQRLKDENGALIRVISKLSKWWREEINSRMSSFKDATLHDWADHNTSILFLPVARVKRSFYFVLIDFPC